MSGEGRFRVGQSTEGGVGRALGGGGFEPVARAQATPALWVAHSVIAALTARRGRPTATLRKPLPVMALMVLARGLLFPWLWLADRAGRGDCLLRVARRAG